MSTPPHDTDPADATFAARDAEFVPDGASHRARRILLTMTVLSLVALVAGAFGTFVAYLYEDLQQISLATLVLTSGFFLLIVSVFPIILLVLGSRHRHREVTRGAARAATVWGVICLILGLVAVVPTLVGSAAEIIEDAAIRSRPPTAAEAEFTPAELRAQAESLIAELAAAADAVPAAVPAGEDPPGFRTEPCELSNRGPGVAVVSHDYRYDTPAESVAAFDGVEAYWRTAGYEPYRSGGDTAVDGLSRQVRVSGGPIEWLAVYAHTASTSDSVLIEYHSICVVK